MIVVCGLCGADLRHGGQCTCSSRDRARASGSRFVEVVMLAAQLGEITPTTLTQAARTVREES